MTFIPPNSSEPPGSGKVVWFFGGSQPTGPTARRLFEIDER